MPKLAASATAQNSMPNEARLFSILIAGATTVCLGFSSQSHADKQTIEFKKQCTAEIKSIRGEEFQIFLSSGTKVAIEKCVNDRNQAFERSVYENSYFNTQQTDQQFRNMLSQNTLMEVKPSIEQLFDFNSDLASEQFRSIGKDLSSQSTEMIPSGFSILRE